MTSTPKPFEPQGDPSRHLPIGELEGALRRMPPGGRDEGRVALIVRRRADCARETPERVLLCADEGVPGDAQVGDRIHVIARVQAA